MLTHTSIELRHHVRADWRLEIGMIIPSQETGTQLGALSIEKKGYNRHAILPVLGLLKSVWPLEPFQLAGEHPFPLDGVDLQTLALINWTHLLLRLDKQDFRIIEKRQIELDLVIGPVGAVPQNAGDSVNEEQQFSSDCSVLSSVSSSVEEKVKIVG